MFRRNGEACQYEVPGYSARLTGSEFRAYQKVVGVVEDQILAHGQGANRLAQVEQSTAKLSQKLSQTKTAESRKTVNVADAKWELVYLLQQRPGSDMLLCSREVGARHEFAVIERFDADSPYAKAQGRHEIHLVSNNPRQLLRNYAEMERHVLQMLRSDVAATVQENLFEQYPGQNLSQVAKAVAARCEVRPVGESVQESEAIANSVKIRF